jgi:energy-coupling factor transport system ATP-binding protein
VIEIKNLCFTYPGHQKDDRVLFNTEINFEKQKFYSIVGPNGSGKSTLARLINGILYPYTGEIIVDGIKVEEKNFEAIRQKVGYIFQNPENQLVSTLVETEVAFALENLCIPRIEMHKRVDDILEFVELLDCKGKPPHMLSGGQKQRLAIASIVVFEPDYIIFDEPTSMLDSRGKKEVNYLIKKLHREGKGVIMITHDPAEIILSDTVVVMNNGKVAAQFTPEEFFTKPENYKWADLKSIPEYIKIGYELGMQKFTREEVACEYVRQYQ